MRLDGWIVRIFIRYIQYQSIADAPNSSLLFGLLPLSLSLSSRQLRLITALGTGVLVGTSLIVIIPEGVETLYSAGESGHSHVGRSVSVLAPRSGYVDMPVGSLENVGKQPDMVAIPFDIGLTQDGCAYVKKRQDDGGAEAPEDGDHETEPEGVEDSEPRDPHVWVGISLITGFILMYLIDTLPRHATPHSRPQRFSISLTQFSLTRDRSSSVPETPTISSSAQHNHGSTSRPSSTTVGLVIHACADGIALGASSTTTGRLSFIIFLAIMIHKAPAAFGLTSVLLKQGLSTRAARAHLIVFSLAAPVGALLTWGAAHLLGYSTAALGSSTSTEFATGVLLLFSGGTFLYVAMHTMQEVGGHSHEEGNGYVGVPMTDIYGSAPSQMPKRDGGASFVDTMVCVVGMLIPLLTQMFGHGH